MKETSTNPRSAAVIVGAGNGLGASLARLFSLEGLRVILMARDGSGLAQLSRDTGARVHTGECSDPEVTASLFSQIDQDGLVPEVVVFNVGSRHRGAIDTLDPAKVEESWRTGCFGAFLVAQQAARRMIPRRRGTLLFTGGTASVRADAENSAVAMAKFGLRALAASVARELSPRGIHVAHVVIDGTIANPEYNGDRRDDNDLDPDAISRTYLELHRQHRSCWTSELSVRPWSESF
ncbi:MAG: SDR family NAD(P)-dependent oxidoreductase [Betaproteobacteria bacterium]|nr:SDR family NAD(P)-dependent oxidoreductase [Betaproteobacteria bacterium]